MQSINSFQHLSSQYIEQVLQIEMERLKANCSREEENYVEEMLLENPIIVERRLTTPSSLPTTLAAGTATLPATSTQTNANRIGTPDYSYYPSVQDVANDEEETVMQQQQQQRSESCRRSRINNKIKKAKMKYRHKFMSNKLLQCANVLECLQKLIQQTENQLINQGFNALQLLKLRNIFYNDLMATV